MKTAPHCPRCGGMMQRERYYDAGEAFEGLKCFACGECVDPLILLHRMNPMAKIPNDMGNVMDLLRQTVAGKALAGGHNPLPAETPEDLEGIEETGGPDAADFLDTLSG